VDAVREEVQIIGRIMAIKTLATDGVDGEKVLDKTVPMILSVKDYAMAHSILKSAGIQDAGDKGFSFIFGAVCYQLMEIKMLSKDSETRQRRIIELKNMIIKTSTPMKNMIKILDAIVVKI
jgi:hypothetical protein